MSKLLPLIPISDQPSCAKTGNSQYQGLTLPVKFCHNWCKRRMICMVSDGACEHQVKTEKADA